jgi:hypothetical protein
MRSRILGRIFPSYKKGTVPAPEEPILSTYRFNNAPVAHPHESVTPRASTLWLPGLSCLL